MDYLTAFGRLFVCLWAIGLSFRLFDYSPTIWVCFWPFDSILAIWLHFGYLTAFWLSFWLFPTIWLSFRLFDCYFGCLTIFQLFDPLFGDLTLFRLFDCLFDYLTVFRQFDWSIRLFECLSAIWLSFGYLIVIPLFDCLLVIQLSFGYTRTTL